MWCDYVIHHTVVCKLDQAANTDWRQYDSKAKGGPNSFPLGGHQISHEIHPMGCSLPSNTLNLFCRWLFFKLCYSFYLVTVASQQVRNASSELTNEQFDNDWVDYFNREDLDDWGLRRGLNELYGFDLVPEPKIVSAALRACRRLNDHAMAVRILESIKVS